MSAAADVVDNGVANALPPPNPTAAALLATLPGVSAIHLLNSSGSLGILSLMNFLISSLSLFDTQLFRSTSSPNKVLTSGHTKRYFDVSR